MSISATMFNVGSCTVLLLEEHHCTWVVYFADEPDGEWWGGTASTATLARQQALATALALGVAPGQQQLYDPLR